MTVRAGRDQSRNNLLRGAKSGQVSFFPGYASTGTHGTVRTLLLGDSGGASLLYPDLFAGDKWHRPAFYDQGFGRCLLLSLT